jgi:dynamin 1-like protein
MVYVSANEKAVSLNVHRYFEVLVRQAIKKMTEPCQKCARIVHDELGRIARQIIANQDVQRYPRLAQSIEDATRDFLAEGLVPAEAMISSLVDCQLAHINTSHPDFVGGSAALRQGCCAALTPGCQISMVACMSMMTACLDHTVCHQLNRALTAK